MSASAPYIDLRAPKRPFVVKMRGGTTGMLIEFHRFASADEAWAYYVANRA